MTRLLPALVVVLSAAAHATVLVPADFREIVNGSDIIVYGRVLEATAQVSDDRGRVETVITFQAGTYLKGAAGQSLTFTVPGGQVGRYRTVFVGAPTFVPGEEMVLFLKRNGAAGPSVFGLNQGVFRVRLGAGSQRVVTLPVVMARGEAPEVVVRGARERRPLPLERFAAEVRAVMNDGPREAR